MAIPKPNLRGLCESKGLGPVAQFLEQEQYPWFAKLFNPDGSIKLVSLSDAAAQNNSLYYSTTGSKASYKDSSGVVHALY